MINVCVKRVLSIVVLAMLTKGFVQAADAPTLKEKFLAKAVLCEQTGRLRDAEIYLHVADSMKKSRMTEYDYAAMYTAAAIFYQNGGSAMRKDLSMARYCAVRAQRIYQSIGDDRVVELTHLIACIDADNYEQNNGF
jgi:hypothetical protein